MQERGELQTFVNEIDKSVGMKRRDEKYHVIYFKSCAHNIKKKKRERKWDKESL